MAQWQTFPIEMNGGLITNISPLQQGINAPGSGRILKNFEPSIKGGYTKIEGFIKYNNSIVPPYGEPTIDGEDNDSGLSSITVSNLSRSPEIGDTFMIGDSDTTYTIVSLTYDPDNYSADIEITPALSNDLDEGDSLLFLSTNTQWLIRGVGVFIDRVIVARNNDLYTTFGGGYKKINTDVRNPSVKTRFARYNYDGTEKIIAVDGNNVPAIWDNNIYTALEDCPADVNGSEFVVNFKNQLFFAKSNLVTFTSPYSDDDFSPATGSGVISVGSDVTSMSVFRDQLIIFTENSIFKLVGNTISDFALQPITVDIGCINPDTVQEIGGDLIFLAPDGLRLLSATDRIGDFGLAVISKTIQKTATDLINSSQSYSSILIRSKSQYRIFGYNFNLPKGNSKGIIGVQFAGQGGDAMQWAETKGIKSFVSDSRFHNGIETIVFANEDGYLYQLEDGNSFDGEDIEATYATPFMPITDPRLRKTFYKMFMYLDPEGGLEFETSLIFNFDEKGIIQPDPIKFNNKAGEVSYYGDPSSRYGITTFGGKLLKVFETQVTGSGFTVSVQIDSKGIDPAFSLDAITLEYAQNARR